MTAKTVADKLLIKPDTRVWSSIPAQLDRIGTLPSGATVVAAPSAAGVAILWADGAASLRGALETYKNDLTKPNVVWVAYPKANKADINRDTIWPIVGEYGLRPNGQVAVDDVWSALRFRPLAAGEAPFMGGRT